MMEAENLDQRDPQRSAPGPAKTIPQSAEVPPRELEATIEHVPGTEKLTDTMPFVEGEGTERGAAHPEGTRPAAKVRVKVAGYEILGQIGRGAMGVVYRAWQPGLKRVVALKMVVAGSHAGEEELARFQAEAEAVAQLQHPHIVQVYEVGKHAGLPFFSMEFVDGQSLQQKLGGKPMETAQAAQMTETLARAMHYAHQRGIVHRDLKPGNVLLTSDGVPKITDFGLAKRLEADSSQTKSGAVIGTPSYMAPEQARGAIHEIGPGTDVYALGATLYAMLTGRPPFAAANSLDTVMQVLHDEPVPPRLLQPKVLRDLETICLKCLQKDPRKRYRDAEALAEDLRRFSAGEVILARRASRGERLWRWCRRNPRVAALSGVASLLALTLLIGSPIAAFRINQARIAAVDAQGVAEQRQIEAVQSQREAEAARRVATQQAELALDAYQKLIGEVQTQMADRPQMQDLRQSLLTMAVGKLQEIARSAENANLIDKETAKAHQKIGRLFEELGKTRLALERHKKAHEIIEVLAAKAPGDPVASKANPAATSNKLGDMYRRLGDLATARQCYLAGLELRKEWARLAPGVPEAVLAVANSQSLLGNVDLMLGDPAAAREHFLQSLKWREKLPQQLGRTGENQREWAGLHDKLGETSCRLDDREEAEKQLGTSLEIRRRLAGANPKSIRLKLDIIISHLQLGDFGLQSMNDPVAAEKYYRLALQDVVELQKTDPRNAYAVRALSMVNYKLGVAELRLGKPDEARALFQECLKQREAMAQQDPEDVGARIDVMLVLARCGQHAEAASIADGLRQDCPGNPWVLYNGACCYSLCASAAGRDEPPGDQTAPGQRYAGSAIELLQKAVDCGWKDFWSLRVDPDLDAIRDHPGYRAFWERLKR